MQKKGTDFIIYETKSLDKGIQMTLYKNEELLDSRVGLLGEFELAGDDVQLKIKNAALKSTHDLMYQGSSLELKKIKLKDLRRQLSENNIYNAVNPTKEELAAGKFDSKRLIIPVSLMIIGFIAQYLTRDMERTYTLMALIPGAIAGWLLYDITIDRFSWLKMRKGRVGFMAAVVVILGLLAEFLF